MQYLRRLRAHFPYLFLAAAALAPAASHAWAAIAIDGHGNARLQYNADTPEEAKRLALEGCRRETGRPCRISVSDMHGTAIVRAKGDDGAGNASNPDPEKAAAAALDQCGKATRNCRIALAAWDNGATWVAIATAANSRGISMGAPDRETARRNAMESCEKDARPAGSCRIAAEDVGSDRYYFVEAGSPKAEKWYVHLSQSSMHEAEQAALQKCAKEHTREDCTVTKRRTNQGPLPEPAAMQKILRMAARFQADAPASSGGPTATRPEPRQPAAPRPRCINPATGLPMVDLHGSCGGVDVMGNPYGMRRP